MNYIQYLLKCGDRVDTLWLPESKGDIRLKVGMSVKIKDKEPEGLWTIQAVYSDIRIPEEKINQNRDESRNFKIIEIAGRRSFK